MYFCEISAKMQNRLICCQQGLELEIENKGEQRVKLSYRATWGIKLEGPKPKVKGAARLGTIYVCSAHLSDSYVMGVRIKRYTRATRSSPTNFSLCANITPPELVLFPYLRRSFVTRPSLLKSSLKL